jgi:hypothetical protein
MKSSGINDYDPAAVIRQQQKAQEENLMQMMKSYEQPIEEIKKG